MKIDHEALEQKATRVGRMFAYVVLVVVVCMASSAFATWLTMNKYTQGVQPAPAEVYVPESVREIDRLEKEIASFKAKRERELGDRDKLIAHLERQVKGLNAVLNREIDQAEALQAATVVPR